MKLLFVLFLCFGSFLSVSAQTGTADTIYVDVPAEVEALRRCRQEGQGKVRKEIPRLLLHADMVL